MINQNKENRSNNCTVDLISLNNSTGNHGNIKVFAVHPSSELSYGKKLNDLDLMIDNNSKNESIRLNDVVSSSGKINEAPDQFLSIFLKLILTIT